MPLEKILQALQAEAEAEIAEIELTTQAEIKQIAAGALAESAVARRSHLPAMQVSTRSERARILNQAKLEALRVVLGARETAIDSVLEVAACRLQELPGSAAYGSLLRDLASEALGALGADSSLRFRVHSRDVALMQGILQELGVPAPVDGGLENDGAGRDVLGGLMAVASEGRINLDNTLVTRLRGVATRNRSQIAQMLLDVGQKD